MKKSKPNIPPGAPGHPRTSSDARNAGGIKARAPRTEKTPRESSPTQASRSVRASPGKARLLYEDDDILAYEKPAGLPVIAADGSRSRSLLDVATEQIKRRNPKGRAAVVHRIDRDTSGTVVFATNARGKKELMGKWDELVTERRYVALVEGSMGGKAGSYDFWLKENRAGQVFRAGIGERGAKRAITRWRLLDEGAGLSLIELSLATGRKHQIRVQLADAGHPLVGDARYGSRPGRDVRDDLGRLCLHAASIELRLPGREPLRFESPVPPEFSYALRRTAPATARVGVVTPTPTNSRNASASRNAEKRVAPHPRAAPRGKKPSSRP